MRPIILRLPSPRAAVSRNGEVFTWGRGAWGQLGHGTLSNEPIPRQVIALASKFVTQTAAGARHTLALTVTGRLYAFGCGEGGALGTGSEGSHTLPTKVRGIGHGRVVAVTAGGGHSCAVVALGSDAASISAQRLALSPR